MPPSLFFPTVQQSMLPKDSQFDLVVKKVDSPTYSAELRAQLIKGLEKVYRSPPYEQASIVLGRDLSPAQTQQMLYFPVPSDMSFYPVLISSPPGYDTRYPSATVFSHYSLTCLILFSTSIPYFRLKDAFFRCYI